MTQFQCSGSIQYQSQNQSLAKLQPKEMKSSKQSVKTLSYNAPTKNFRNNHLLDGSERLLKSTTVDGFEDSPQ